MNGLTAEALKAALLAVPDNRSPEARPTNRLIIAKGWEENPATVAQVLQQIRRPPSVPARISYSTADDYEACEAKAWFAHAIGLRKAQEESAAGGVVLHAQIDAAGKDPAAFAKTLEAPTVHPTVVAAWRNGHIPIPAPGRIVLREAQWRLHVPKLPGPVLATGIIDLVRLDWDDKRKGWFLEIGDYKGKKSSNACKNYGLTKAQLITDLQLGAYAGVILVAMRALGEAVLPDVAVGQTYLSRDAEDPFSRRVGATITHGTAFAALERLFKVAEKMRAPEFAQETDWRALGKDWTHCSKYVSRMSTERFSCSYAPICHGMVDGPSDLEMEGDVPVPQRILDKPISLLPPDAPPHPAAAHWEPGQKAVTEEKQMSTNGNGGLGDWETLFMGAVPVAAPQKPAAAPAQAPPPVQAAVQAQAAPTDSFDGMLAAIGAGNAKADGKAKATTPAPAQAPAVVAPPAPVETPPQTPAGDVEITLHVAPNVVPKAEPSPEHPSKAERVAVGQEGKAIGVLYVGCGPTAVGPGVVFLADVLPKLEAEAVAHANKRFLRKEDPTGGITRIRQLDFGRWRAPMGEVVEAWVRGQKGGIAELVCEPGNDLSDEAIAALRPLAAKTIRPFGGRA